MAVFLTDLLLIRQQSQSLCPMGVHHSLQASHELLPLCLQPPLTSLHGNQLLLKFCHPAHIQNNVMVRLVTEECETSDISHRTGKQSTAPNVRILPVSSFLAREVLCSLLVGITVLLNQLVMATAQIFI